MPGTSPRMLGEAERPASDVLLVSPGTTRGLQIADRDLAAMLGDAGASVVTCALGPLPRGWGDPVDDLRESWVARRTVHAAIARLAPRCVVLSTPTPALALGPLPVPHAIWFDQTAAFHLHGVRNAIVRALERRALARASLLMPYSEQAIRLIPAVAAPLAVIPTPVAESRAPLDGEREPLVVTYAAGPWEKGLDLICAAWTASGCAPDARLVVTGIAESEARRFLRRRGVGGDAAGIEFPGMLPPAAFARLLRRARAFVAASRSEGFGQAALQALDAGALLVAAPCPGPFPALDLARRLDRTLVAAELAPPAIAHALRCALAAPEADAAAYRRRARALLEPYRRPVIVDSLRDVVLPRLLGGAPG